MQMKMIYFLVLFKKRLNNILYNLRDLAFLPKLRHDATVSCSDIVIFCVVLVTLQ